MDKARRSLTPGSYDPAVTVDQVRSKGFAASRRPNRWVSMKLKGQALKRYGISLTPFNWHRHILDHLIPLELGGMPIDPDNLWPQPKADAKAKDADENTKHRAVVAGTTLLVNAQRFFKTSWTA